MSNVDLMQLVGKKVKDLEAYQVENVDCEVKLHANENPFSPPGELLDHFRESLPDFQLNRYPDPDCRELKQAISRRVGQPVENLAIGNGSDELIQILLQIFCDAGDSIAFPDPTFAMYSIIARGMGLHLHGVALDEGWDFGGQEFLQSIKNDGPRVVFLSYPNNPTGNCFSEDAVGEVIRDFQGIVVVDEAYHDFSQRSFVNHIEKHNNMVILRSLSKIGMAALRVGYAVADPVIIEQINKIRLPYNSNTVSQSFASQLLSNFSSVQKQIDCIIEERRRVLRVLADETAVTVFPSDSNFILFRVDRGGSDLFRKLIQKGILVRDLSAHPRLKNCLRVTIGTPEENDRFLTGLKASTE